MSQEEFIVRLKSLAEEANASDNRSLKFASLALRVVGGALHEGRIQDLAAICNLFAEDALKRLKEKKN